MVREGDGNSAALVIDPSEDPLSFERQTWTHGTRLFDVT